MPGLIHYDLLSSKTSALANPFASLQAMTIVRTKSMASMRPEISVFKFGLVMALCGSQRDNLRGSGQDQDGGPAMSNSKIDVPE